MSKSAVRDAQIFLWHVPIHKEKVSPCRALCPLESGIPQWMEKVKKGDWAGAWNIIRRFNPFPAITGHVCYQFCQEKCNRGLWDEAIAIREIEKAIGSWRHENYTPSKCLEKDNGRQKKVAIIGSGPAGLSCAYFLNMMGAAVTVFEKLPVAGGLLATGIPEYRLPRNILKKELEILQSAGIVIKTGLDVGKDMSLITNLKKDYDAIVLASGAQNSEKLNVSGDELSGVCGAIEFLRDVHLQKMQEVNGRVVVVGGGNAALDAASIAKLHGAKEVILLYRRSEKEMPAHPDEIRSAREAGVNFIFNTVIKEIIGKEKVEKICVLQTAPSQRGDPVRVLPGTEKILECNMVIIAAGQKSNIQEFSCLLSSVKEAGILLEREGYINNESCIIVAAGDNITGPGTVAGAIFSGRKASLVLSNLLSIVEEIDEVNNSIAKPLQADEKERIITIDFLNPHFYLRQKSFTLLEKEAGRCFSCGYCNNCGVCWALCPDFAVKKVKEHYEFIFEYCKGCGVCVSECPTNVLEMN